MKKFIRLDLFLLAAQVFCLWTLWVIASHVGEALLDEWSPSAMPALARWILVERTPFFAGAATLLVVIHAWLAIRWGENVGARQVVVSMAVILVAASLVALALLMSRTLVRPLIPLKNAPSGVPG